MMRAERVQIDSATGLDRNQNGHSAQTSTLLTLAKPYEKVRAFRSKSPPKKVPVGKRTKRIFDVVAATIILLLASPLFLFVAIAVAAARNGPAIFPHSRIGFSGRAFNCLKFRTMVVDADEALRKVLQSDPEALKEWALNQKLKRDPRITRIGQFLRRTSLDELPQLLNVIRGDMSLVGPRPVVGEELERYGRRRTAYLAARPGLTGLWQVSGRNKTTYDRRTKLDVAYARGWSLRRDVVIIAKTVPELIFSKGAF